MFIRPSQSRFYLYIYIYIFYLFYRSIYSACVRFLTVIGALQMSRWWRWWWWWITNDCDEGPVRGQTYSYLPSLKASSPISVIPKWRCLVTKVGERQIVPKPGTSSRKWSIADSDKPQRKRQVHGRSMTADAVSAHYTEQVRKRWGVQFVLFASDCGNVCTDTPR